MDWELIASGVTVAAKALRKLGANKTLVRVRDRVTLGMLAPLHYEVVHHMRQLSALMASKLPDAEDAATRQGVVVCNECRVLMGHALELRANELHCCLKVMISGKNIGDPERVATWVRSEPLDNRPVETGEDNAHEVEKNTVWSCLMGQCDGKTQWQPFPCFACNDLLHAGGHFRCDRKNWQKYYKSAIVFPIRYPPRAQSTEFTQIGFLAFDSPRINAFPRVPNIFEFLDNPTGFRDALEATMVFNLGAIMADVLSTCMRPHDESAVGKETNNVTT